MKLSSINSIARGSRLKNLIKSSFLLITPNSFGFIKSLIQPPMTATTLILLFPTFAQVLLQLHLFALSKPSAIHRCYSPWNSPN